MAKDKQVELTHLSGEAPEVWGAILLDENDKPIGAVRVWGGVRLQKGDTITIEYKPTKKE